MQWVLNVKPLPYTMCQESLLRLNYDILRAIIELLSSTDGLKELSQTSRQIRDICMPILFRTTFRPVFFRLPEPHMFLPYSLWSHIQVLVVRDECGENCDAYELRYTDNCLLCGVLAGPLVERWLAGMPQLRSITFYQRTRQPVAHGMSWPALRAVLSLPAIRELKLDRLHFCPALRPSDELRLDSIAPLTSLKYLAGTAAESLMVRPFRTPPDYNAEMAALSVTVQALHETLETLCLPTSSVPIHVFSLRPWPRLWRLILRGAPSEGLMTSLLTSLSHIPTLRSLVLKLSCTRSMGEIIRPGVLWRDEVISAFPCPALEELVVTYPDPDDKLFDHLPPTLLSLSLCCWRHLYHDFLSPYRSWNPSNGPRFGLLLRSSEIYQMLCRSRTPDLVHLTLEYRADDRDDELLRHIAQSYPRLTRLKFIRYRPRGVNGVPVESIARAFSALTCLSELKLHLDLAEMPLPSRPLMRGGGGVYSVPGMQQFQVVVNETVQTFARELSSSVRRLSLFTPTAVNSDWARFRVSDGKAMYEEDSESTVSHTTRLYLS